MVVVTWDGSTDTDYGTAANWDTDSVPTSSDDIIIASVSNDCVLDGTRSVNSITVQSGGDFNGNTEMLTVVGEADGTGATTNGYAVRLETDSEIVGTTTDITITTPAATNVLMQPTTGNVRHLTINHASAVVNIRNNTTLSGNLTITAGTLDTTGSDYALTVTGTTDVAGTLTCNASTCSFGSGVTSGYGLSVAVSGTFTGGSGTHTMGSLRGVGGSPGATITLSSGVTTIDSEYQSGNQVIEISSGINSWNNGSGTLTITTAAASNFVLNKSGATLNNFIINHSSADITLTTTALTVAGNMTITAGEFDTSGSNLALTVTGDCVVGTGTATLTLNDSVVELGALAIDSSTATVTATSGGTLNITTGSTSLPGESSSMSIYSDEGNINHAGTITITAGSYFDIVGTTSIVNDVIMDGGSYYVRAPTIGGDLTINASKQLLTYGGTQNLTVTGDLILNGRLNLTGGTSADVVCGSLTIASGGEYIAHASGTTTITGESGDYALNNAGTFTHNNGKFKLEGSNDTRLLNSTYYDLEISMSAAGKQVDLYDSSGSAIDILGDLTVTTGRLTAESPSDALTVYGLTNIAANGTCWYDADSDTNKITHHGLVTNLGAYRINDGTTVKLNGGIRQLGTLTIT